MVVADNTIWVIFLAIFNYAIIYRRNVLLGSIGYLTLGLITLQIASSTTNTAVGFFILFGSLVNMTYELVNKYNASKPLVR